MSVFQYHTPGGPTDTAPGGLTETTPGQPAGNVFELSDEELHSLRHCSRCNRYYTIHEDMDGCYYHPGTYTDRRLTLGTQVGWSCCRLKDEPGKMFKCEINPDAMEVHGKGCRFSATHEEDIKFTKTLHSFPFHHKSFAKLRAEYIAQRQRDAELYGDGRPGKKSLRAGKAGAQDTETPGKPKGVHALRDNPDYIEHPVSPADTLFGVALKYGMEVSDLKRVNKLRGNDVIGRKVLYIPRSASALAAKPANQEQSDAAKRRTIVRKFMDITNCDSLEEAKFYLDETEYDLSRAIAMFNEDSAWETSNAGFSATSSSP